MLTHKVAIGTILAFFFLIFYFGGKRILLQNSTGSKDFKKWNLIHIPSFILTIFIVVL